MATRSDPPFPVDRLRREAGDRSYARGEAYHRDGRVELMAMAPYRVAALVAGGEDYYVELDGTGGSVGGWCTCPAFAGFGFCKHLVATALAANATPDGLDGGGPLARIRGHLAGQGVDALVDAILALAVRHPNLLRRLQRAATARPGSPDAEWWDDDPDEDLDDFME